MNYFKMTMLSIVILLVTIKGNLAACSNGNCARQQCTPCTCILECNPLQSSIVAATPKRVVKVMSDRVVGIIADGNDVYIARVDDSTVGSVSKYDQDGNWIATFSIPEGKPRFFEIQNNDLYVTTGGDDFKGIYVKCRNEDRFTKVLELTTSAAPCYMRYTPDGEKFVLSFYPDNTVFVYNKDFSINTTFDVPGVIGNVGIRDMHFDSESNLYITIFTSVIQVYNKNYEFVRTITYPGAVRLDGWLFQCDGSKILADRSGKVLFVDKDDNVQQVHTDGFTGTIGVAITESGALFVLDFNKEKLFIY